MKLIKQEEIDAAVQDYVEEADYPEAETYAFEAGVEFAECKVVDAVKDIIIENQGLKLFKDKNEKWNKLSKINPNPASWLMMYKNYLELLTQQDVSAWWQEQFEIANKERNSLKENFPNGFTSWYETFYEIVAGFYCMPDNKFLQEVEDANGRGGMWELAKDLTDKFEKKHRDTNWEDKDMSYFETNYEFLEEELK